MIAACTTSRTGSAKHVTHLCKTMTNLSHYTDNIKVFLSKVYYKPFNNTRTTTNTGYANHPHYILALQTMHMANIRYQLCNIHPPLIQLASKRVIIAPRTTSVITHLWNQLPKLQERNKTLALQILAVQPSSSINSTSFRKPFNNTRTTSNTGSTNHAHGQHQILTVQPSSSIN